MIRSYKYCKINKKLPELKKIEASSSIGRAGRESEHAVEERERFLWCEKTETRVVEGDDDGDLRDAIEVGVLTKNNGLIPTTTKRLIHMQLLSISQRDKERV